MPEADSLRSSIKLLMFDQYGTVVDMQGGLIEVATPYLKSKGWSGRPDAFVTWWRRTHFENSMIDALLHREHIPYRRIGEISVDTTLERAGIEHTDEEVSYLVAQIEKLRPFPDVPAAMALLHKHYKLGVLSNGDPDMLEAARPYHGIAFDHIISVASAGSFKPHVSTYTKAAAIAGVALDQILFVANHAFDCIGAKAAGMRTAFVDRRKRPFGKWPYQPDLIVSDFAELTAHLVPGNAARA
jgi:2-haloacid dehalogenase